ncbi:MULTISPECIES: hypothetical protein [unclassified Kaistella]|uniref:hypothetical protein n=1 Tax=unclassified Kaistella TaxID=2762626 RepID=UPI002733FC50|nr:MULTISPECIES: hypothetical protein [unclassified Kaistella]MCZ2082896.1 hypothetical protein [Flavobacteriales bacterium]MDP2453994.1 hypothetical protein [Kaistella sp. SH11-4b]MDP2457051.1 hypothetical protein [Kaistella sp. SH40-3]MDP2459808.1 hypothetical protein [Kaistella sp. SH19-2b]
MTPQDNTHEQKENLEEMNYSSENDIFNQEEHISLDGDGNPIENEQQEIEKVGDDLDVPGSSADDEMEEIGSEDEENNFYSLSDNEDNHEEENEDLLS